MNNFAALAVMVVVDELDDREFAALCLHVQLGMDPRGKPFYENTSASTLFTEEDQNGVPRVHEVTKEVLMPIALSRV